MIYLGSEVTRPLLSTDMVQPRRVADELALCLGGRPLGLCGVTQRVDFVGRLRLTQWQVPEEEIMVEPWGSGGGNDGSVRGGRGGGYIQLHVAASTSLSGVIRTHGLAGTGTAGGGGTGGGVFVKAHY